MPYQPADIPEKYKNTIDDLLLAILNSLPVPNGDPGTVLDGTFNWSIPTAATLPTGGTGDILTYQAGAWSIFPRWGLFTWTGTNAKMNFLQGDEIKIGGNSLTNPTGGVIQANGLFKTVDNLICGQHLTIPNKAQDGGHLTVIERVTSGAEAAVNLLNVTAINTNVSGNWLPATDNTTDLGSTTKKFRYGHFANNVLALGFTTGEAQWKLGQKLTGPVTLDTGNFIQVTIAGVQYKLLIST